MINTGIEKNVDIRLEDYRDVRGLYDKIVSIEMLEAVGEKFWRRYFESVRDRLAPGGKAAIQTITIKDDCFESYKKNPDFIQQFIFPGGMLPTPSAIKDNVESVGLKLTDTFFFGKSYIKTLHLWDQEFKKQWSRIEKLGFDTDFKNTWTYYLNYCAAISKWPNRRWAIFNSEKLTESQKIGDPKQISGRKLPRRFQFYRRCRQLGNEFFNPIEQEHSF